MHKRGQSQIFVYILGLIIVGLVLFVGYKSLINFNKSGQQLLTIEFERDLADDISKLSKPSEFGSKLKKTYSLPSGFDEICFVDLNSVSLEEVDKAFVKTSVESGVRDNVFLFGADTESFHVDGLKLLEPFYYCIVSDSVSLTIEGVGGSALVYTPVYEKYCQNAQSGDLCEGLDIAFYEGYRDGCCSKYSLCCT